jgi:hypothetical protein
VSNPRLPGFDDHHAPIIIIAAARSGTKILRAVLAKSSHIVDFRYDINYIWKYGNYHIQHDELTTENSTPAIRKFIREKFNKLLLKSDAKRVLEKTVSNSLRVDFVRAVFPGCKVVHLYRDGRDVAADARLCWQSSAFSGRIQSKRDVIRKIMAFPVVRAWPYLASYLSTYAKRLIGREKHVKSWGPRFKGIDEALEKFSLLEVCGIQWARSVELSLRSLSRLEEGADYINVRYEDLVRNSRTQLTRILDFLELEDSERVLEYGSKNLTDSYVGFSQRALTTDELTKLNPHIKESMKILYSV